MSFLCRAVNTISGQSFYIYRDVGYFQISTNSPPPVTISDANTICQLGSSAYTAIDAQVMYSNGLIDGITDPVNVAGALQTIGVDSYSILYCYTWGAGAVLFMFALGYAIGAGRKVINKI